MGESKGKVTALAITFIFLPIVAVALRFWAKAMKKARPTSDDYMVLLALVFTLGTGACQLVAGFLGNLGQHITYDASGAPNQLAQVTTYLKAEYAFELQAKLAIVCAKLSLILLYRRIFVSQPFRRATWVVGTIVIVWNGAFILAYIFQCTPIEVVWDFTITAPKCLNRIMLWEAYAISDVLTDVMVLSMPIPAVWQLQMGNKQKLAVSSIFLLGAIVVASGITRTVIFFNIASSPPTDTTYSAAPAMYWSFIETSLGTVCACLPTLRPLFAHVTLESFLGNIRSFLSLQYRSSKLGESTTNNTTSALSDGVSGNGISVKKREENFRATAISNEAYADHLPLVNLQ